MVATDASDNGTFSFTNAAKAGDQVSIMSAGAAAQTRRSEFPRRIERGNGELFDKWLDRGSTLWRNVGV